MEENEQENSKSEKQENTKRKTKEIQENKIE